MKNAETLLSSLVRTSPATGKVLVGLVRESHDPISLTDLARSSGVSPATAMREANRLADAGLVCEHDHLGRERLVQIDQTSPLYPPITDLVYLSTGATPMPADPAFSDMRSCFAIDDVVLARHMPDELLSTDGTLPGEVDDGPSLLHARAAILQLDSLLDAIRAIQQRLQTSYDRWHNERDRDLVHLVLRAGSGTDQARRVLDHQSRDLDRTNVGRLAWAHAFHAVAADERILDEIADELEEAISLAERRAQLLQAITEHETNLAGLPDDRAGYRRNLVEKLEANRGELATTEAAMEGTYRYGGLCEIDSVGTAGERILVEELRGLARQAAQCANDMAPDPSFGE